MTGVITTLIPLRQDHAGKSRGGYGFIRDADGHDRFFHARDLLDADFTDLSTGRKVTFDPTSGNTSRTGGGNGLRAEQVFVV